MGRLERRITRLEKGGTDIVMQIFNARLKGFAVMKVVLAFGIIAAVTYFFYSNNGVPSTLSGEREHLIDQFYINIGLLYGILAVFTVFVIWEKFNRMVEVMNEEASSLMSILRYARHLKDKDVTKQITKKVYSYVSEVKRALWTGEPVEDERVTVAFDEMYTCLDRFDIKGEKDSILMDHLIDELTQTSHMRALRVGILQERVTPIQWFLLLFLPTGLLFIFYITEGDHLVKTILAGLMATAFVITSIIIADMDEPIGGEWGIKPTMYQNVLDSVSEYEKRGRPSHS